MAIDHINYELCISCGACINACEADVIRMDDKTRKPKITYGDDCVLCGRCTSDCPTHAIHISPELYVPITSLFGA